MLAHSFWIESSSKLLVTRTGIKARTSLISGRIRLHTCEPSLIIREAPWNEPKNFFLNIPLFTKISKSPSSELRIFLYILYIFENIPEMKGKSPWCPFQTYHMYETTHFAVTCPWMMKILHFRTWISLRPVGQSWWNFMCSITGGGDRLHNVLRQMGSKPRCPWQQKDPFDLLWGKWCLHLFLVAFDLILFILAGNKDTYKISSKFEFQPDRTTDYGINCLERLKNFP